MENRVLRVELASFFVSFKTIGLSCLVEMFVLVLVTRTWVTPQFKVTFTTSRDESFFHHFILTVTILRSIPENLTYVTSESKRILVK